MQKPPVQTLAKVESIASKKGIPAREKAKISMTDRAMYMM